MPPYYNMTPDLQPLVNPYYNDRRLWSSSCWVCQTTSYVLVIYPMQYSLLQCNVAIRESFLFWVLAFHHYRLQNQVNK